MPANPILALNDVVEFTVKGKSTADNQMVLNRSYWKVASAAAPPIDDLLDTLDELRMRWQSAFLTVLSEDYTVDSYECRRVSGISPFTGIGQPFVVFYDAAVARAPVGDDGLIAGLVLPCFIAASIRFQTGFVGRYWRGGMRLGTLPDSYKATAAGFTNVWGAAAQTAMDAAATSFINSIVTAGGNTLQVQVFSPTYWYNVLQSQGAASDAVAAVMVASVSTYIRHQDSREAPRVP